MGWKDHLRCSYLPDPWKQITVAVWARPVGWNVRCIRFILTEEQDKKVCNSELFMNELYTTVCRSQLLYTVIFGARFIRI